MRASTQPLSHSHSMPNALRHLPASALTACSELSELLFPTAHFLYHLPSTKLLHLHALFKQGIWNSVGPPSSLLATANGKTPKPQHDAANSPRMLATMRAPSNCGYFLAILRMASSAAFCGDSPAFSCHSTTSSLISYAPDRISSTA